MPHRRRFAPTRRIVLLALAAWAMPAAPASAQTVRPVIVEHQGTRALGRFELVNDQLLPLNVILEAKSFDVTEDGDPEFRALDPAIRLKLSEMSFRIPARQSRAIFFEAEAESIPAWFTIYATFAGMPRRQGMEIQVELPHTVYMLPKRPLAREDVRVVAATYDSTARRVEVLLRNVGPRLGRVEEVEASAAKERRRHGSFPLLPGATRRVVIPWDAAGAPSQVRLRFSKFAIEDSLRAG
jgi:hypothetical protein